MDSENPKGHLYKTCPVVDNGTIYVPGGENEAGALATVYYATPNPGGSFPNNKWNEATELNISGTVTTDSAQAVVYNNGIVLMAGDQDGDAHDWPCVFQGDVTGTGSITWRTSTTLPTLPPLPVSVSRNAGATDGNYIYSLGGNQGGHDKDYIYYLALP